MLLLCSACRDRRYMSFRGCSHSNRTKESIYSELKKSEKTTEPDWLSHRSRLIPMLNLAGTKKMPIENEKSLSLVGNYQCTDLRPASCPPFNCFLCLTIFNTLRRIAPGRRLIQEMNNVFDRPKTEPDIIPGGWSWTAPLFHLPQPFPW